ncbi:hypothetical protein [Alishewanella jeotgali]|uniref:hypothetical protein n=1 Tax=Alishewanella jeotgali TaxID=545533 RepID=UPI001ED9662C|nr:hypothetical protein [Alishewanella jeotgali]
MASTTTGGGGGGGGGGTTTGSLLLLQALRVARIAAATESEMTFFIVLTLQLIVARKTYAGKKTQDQLCPAQKTEWFIEKNNLI